MGLPIRTTVIGCLLLKPFFCVACALLAFSTVYGQQGSGVVDFSQAISRTLEKNPTLQAQGYNVRAQEARVTQAGIKPKPELFVGVENVLGAGENDLFYAAQTTFSISWILERGVRQRRVEAARAGISVLETDTAISRLDAAAETARRYLDALVLQTRMTNAREGIRLAENAVEAIQLRVDAGSTPTAELARARAELARRELVLEDIEHELLSAYYRLGAQWGETEPSFSRVLGDLLGQPDIVSFETMRERLEENPDLTRYLSEQRLNEAQLRLAQAGNKQPWRVSTGVRQLELTGDHAFVAEFTMPIGRQDSNRGRVEEMRAEIAKTALEAEAERVRLETALFVIYQELQHSLQLTSAIREQILPLYEQALEQTQQAYEAGRYSFLEWNGAQLDLLSAREDLINASAGIYANLTEIERITGVQVNISNLSQ